MLSMITRNQGLILGGFLLAMLLLVLINILVPFGGGKKQASPAAKLQIVSAKMHPATSDGKRHLEFTVSQPISADTSYKVILGTKTGYVIDGTGLLTTKERPAGPTFLINVMELPRFDQPDKKKMIEEHVKAGNIYRVEIAIYNRGEFLHDPDIFTDARKIAWAEFIDP